MQTKDIMEVALKNIKRDDILKTSLFELEGSEATDEQKEVFNDMLSSVNDTLMAICYLYLPQKAKENIVVENKTFLYSNLSKTLIDVLKLKDKHGVFHKFSTYPTYIKCDNGEFEITYSYQPDILENLTDEVLIVDKNISVNLLASGAVANFYLKRGLFEDSNMWESDFKKQIVLCKKTKQIFEMKVKEW